MHSRAASPRLALMLALLLPTFVAKAAPVETTSPPVGNGNVAASLPLQLPGFEADKTLPMDRPEPKPAQPACIVNADQLPDNFLSLMQKLETPVHDLPTGSVPDEASTASATSPLSPRLPQSRPPTNTSLSANSARNAIAAPTIQGAHIERRQENGVTVFRGRGSAQRAAE